MAVLVAVTVVAAPWPSAPLLLLPSHAALPPDLAPFAHAPFALAAVVAAALAAGAAALVEAAPASWRSVRSNWAWALSELLREACFLMLLLEMLLLCVLLCLCLKEAEQERACLLNHSVAPSLTWTAVAAAACWVVDQLSVDVAWVDQLSVRGPRCVASCRGAGAGLCAALAVVAAVVVGALSAWVGVQSCRACRRWGASLMGGATAEKACCWAAESCECPPTADGMQSAAWAPHSVCDAAAAVCCFL